MIIKSFNLSLEEATNVFYSFDKNLLLNSLSPTYVFKDSLRNPKLIPTFWFANYNQFKFLHCFHLTINKEYNINDIESAYGYGGPISNTENTEFLDLVANKFELWAVENNIIAEFIRFHPLIGNHNWYMGEISENRQTVYIDLETDFFSNYESRRKTDIKRGLERLTIEKVSNNLMLEIFPNLYFNNMEEVKANSFYFFNKEYLKSLISSFFTDSWIIKYQDEIVASTLTIKSDKSKTVEYHLSASSIKGRKNKATSFMIHALSNYYKEKNYKKFYLGGGRSSEENDKLLFFKRGFSSKRKTFFIGHKIFNKKKYDEIKSLNKKKFNNNKILFYKED